MSSSSRRSFLASGRGRWPDLPNNELRLQAHLLMELECGGKSYDEVADFLLHLFPDLSKETLRHLVSYIKTKRNKTKTSSPSERESFLLQQFNVTGVGPHL